MNFVIQHLFHWRNPEVLPFEKTVRRDWRWERIFLRRKNIGKVSMKLTSILFWWKCIFCRGLDMLKIYFKLAVYLDLLSEDFRRQNVMVTEY